MKLSDRMRRHKALTILVFVCAALFVAWLFCLPRNLFKGTDYSTVVVDRSGELLGARIAGDQQWRFPPCESVPDRYAKALIEFEDRHFRVHPGVDPFALGRALWQNIRQKKIVSGGSTITMQVIRMSRGKDRTVWQKMVEAVLATRLEARCSKNEILALYATHAPFGGNVVGIEAASWRYFGRGSEDLSWGEAATLAVLPNSPGSIHLAKNRDRLLAKRNRLLGRLYDKGFMSLDDYTLACEEPLPGEPMPLPSYAFQYVEKCCAEAPGTRIRTGIDLGLQKQVEAIADRWCREFSLGGMNDLAAIVVDVHSGEPRAWVGNSDRDRQRPGVKVDVGSAPRSTGSTLKPLLYCAMLQDGDILPNTLLQDTPVNINGFAPQNFDMQYSGAVPASEALSRSLNVPWVRMLQQFGVPKFYELLKKAGMTSLNRSAADYGLSLILGGAEGRLCDLTRIYADMARWYSLTDESIKKDKALSKRFKDYPFYDRTAMWHTFQALSEVSRPDEMDWKMIASVRKVAWKTGTSWGFRDAWALGTTRDYAVGVWVGNAQGQGAAGLVGARTAGPVMFDIFNLLPNSDWFGEPEYGDYIVSEVCRMSGQLSGPFCEECDTLKLPKNAMRSKACSYHKEIDGRIWFILPPAVEWYYRQRHPEYVPLPPAAPGSRRGGEHVPMEFIYPQSGTSISLPRQMDGSPGCAVFTLAHSNPSTRVFWHLDGDYIGSTTYIHQMTVAPAPGEHGMTVVDADGNSINISFSIQ